MDLLRHAVLFPVSVKKQRWRSSTNVVGATFAATTWRPLDGRKRPNMQRWLWASKRSKWLQFDLFKADVDRGW